MIQKRLLSLLVCGVMLSVVSAPTTLAQGSSRLSLDECLRTALANNLDLVSARKDPAIAEQQIEVNQAPFDGEFTTGANFSRNEGDETIVDKISGASAPGSSESDVLTADVAFNHLLPYGGSYSLTYDYTDVDFASTSIQASTGFLTSSTFIQEVGGLTLDYSMPLLGGFGTETNTINILLARGNLDISKEDLRLQAMLTLNSVEDAYWDVVAAKRALGTFELSLKRAKDLLELNKKKVEVGTLAPIEITEAEAGVAAQVEAVIVGKTTLEDAEDVLLQLLAVPESDPMWEQSLELTDEPSFQPVTVDLDDAIATALERRPEMVSARRQLRNNELSQRVAKKGIRHQLDLTAGITPNKQDDIDRFVETLAGGTFPPSNTATESEDTDWNVGLRYTFKLRNRAAKTNFAIARLNTEKSDVAVRNAEQDIRVEVRRSARNLESGMQRVEAARKNVELQQKKLEAEHKKFDNGMSTSFEVLTFQNDLADSELSAIRAGLDYLKSLTALERSKGTLLEARGLSLGE